MNSTSRNCETPGAPPFRFEGWDSTDIFILGLLFLASETARAPSALMIPLTHPFRKNAEKDARALAPQPSPAQML
jgi:hypothetical protein